MKAVEGMITRKIADETLLIPTGELSQKYNGLITVNEVSAFIWEKLEKECTFEELLEAVLSEFEVSREQAETDLRALLDKLRQMELIIG